MIIQKGSIEAKRLSYLEYVLVKMWNTRQN